MKMQGSTLVVQPMDWTPLRDIEDIEPLGEADTACMQDIYAVLKKHGKQDRFGVTLLHKHFEIADDEVLMEHTNATDRKLVLQPMKADSDDAARSIQTSWALSELDGKPMRACLRRCFRNIQGGHSDGGHYWA